MRLVFVNSGRDCSHGEINRREEFSVKESAGKINRGFFFWRVDRSTILDGEGGNVLKRMANPWGICGRWN